tara:strand:- start:47 stop:226 length:180 start_codon:yes stop_codon:yes gene_type:complete
MKKELNNWLCDECLSDDIKIIDDKDNEMNCYCNGCKQENYIVSAWYINTNKKEVLSNER